MTQVDFYVLAGQTRREQWLFACRLLEKALEKNNQVLLLTDNEQHAQKLDEMIWTYRPDAFIPHALLGATDAPANCPVSIGWQQDNPGHHHDLIINLSQHLPPFFSRFERYVSVVVQHDLVLDYTRNHYKFLKDRGYPVNTVDMRLR